MDSDVSKLDWMYKNANSLVNRDEYLLGKTVDKSLEQLNENEKQNNVSSAPKNHVEHECIPPSIRDFNKTLPVDQVDISSKMNEDPLVAIRRKQEEARRQFLQNPVQLKKLQDALLAKEEQKKYSSKQNNKRNKLDKEKTLDTILTHKYNTFKHLLAEEDLQKILAIGKKKKKRISKSSESHILDSPHLLPEKSKYAQRPSHKINKSKENGKHSVKYVQIKEEPVFESELDRKILEKLKALDRDNEKEVKSSLNFLLPEKPDFLKYSTNTNNLTEGETKKQIYLSSDSDNEVSKPKAFGLVSSDGKKIALKNNKDDFQRGKLHLQKGVEKYEKKQRKKLTEDEKEKLRREMMQNAQVRDMEREANVKRYNERDIREEEKTSKNYNSDFVHMELLKSTKNSTVEDRIKSNLNNIQRSSVHMEYNFSKR